MKRLFAIARVTFRETARDKVLYAILFFACVLILFAWAVGQLSLHEEVRITKDIGLGGISLFGVVLSIFAGVNLVYKEIERKTLYALIPKPIARWYLVVGKYLGLVVTLGAQFLLLVAVLWLALAVQGGHFDGPMIRATVLLFAQVVVVTAIAVFFSTFSTPYLSGLFTAGLTVIGRSTPELHALVSARFKDDPTSGTLLHRALALLPDLHLFYVSGAMVDGKTVSLHAGDYVSWSYVATASGYGALYAAVVLLLAVAIFARRDFV